MLLAIIFHESQAQKHVHEKSSLKVHGEDSSLGLKLNAIRCENISLMFAM